MPAFRVMVKKSREKKQQEAIEKDQHVIEIENNLFKGIFLQNVFETTTESSPASLTATVDGAADLPARNLKQREKFHDMPLSSISDYFWP